MMDQTHHEMGGRGRANRQRRNWMDGRSDVGEP